MTQSTLSEGIISVSYLSKIENGSVEPSEEVLELLNKRLNASPFLDRSIQQENKCIEFYNNLFRKEIDEAKKNYQQLQKNLEFLKFSDLFNLLEIHKLRYFIIIEDIHQAAEQYNKLQKLSNQFNPIQKYYWLKHSANFHFKELSFNRALEFYQEALIYISNDIESRNEEENDLYYSIGLTASHLRKKHLALEFANKSLKYYRNKYNLERAADCHIIIGISLSVMNEYEKSLENFQLALTIAKSIKDTSLYALCLQNIGKLYSIQNSSIKAIEYYLKSFEMRKNSPAVKRIIPISSLMKEYYNIDDIYHAEKWLDRGLELVQSLDQKDSIYVYEFKVYNHLIKGFDSSFEDLILKYVLPFFKEKQLYYEQYRYLKILATYYFDNRKYKLSATYFDQASDVLTNLINE